MITSTSNPQVKSLIQLRKKAKARKEQGIFLVEGTRIAREVPPDRIEAVYASESFLREPENEELVKRLLRDGECPGELRCEVLSDAVFWHVSDTRTPQGILCLVRMREYRPEEVFAASDCRDMDTGDAPAGLWMVLESLQDPGHLGTVFRTAEGVGASGIILDTATADPYNPKTIRSTMGSILRMPFLVSENLPATLEEMRSRGIRIFAADGRKYADVTEPFHVCGAAGVSYTDADYTGPTAFVIGNEGNGLSGDARAAADDLVRIPMRGQLESLNASTAAAVLLYEADRQRRQKRGAML